MQGRFYTSQQGMPYASRPLFTVNAINPMPAIVVYTRKFCGYCTAAKQLLESRGYTFTEVNLDEQPFELTQDIMRRSGQRTVPQIFVDDQPIGGYRELAASLRSGDFPA
ncbi:MAG: glutaredoxin 3 [Pseudomonadota bacterium]|jgi:glutaredoxin 3